MTEANADVVGGRSSWLSLEETPLAIVSILFPFAAAFGLLSAAAANWYRPETPALAYLIVVIPMAIALRALAQNTRVIEGLKSMAFVLAVASGFLISTLWIDSPIRSLSLELGDAQTHTLALSDPDPAMRAEACGHILSEGAQPGRLQQVLRDLRADVAASCTRSLVGENQREARGYLKRRFVDRVRNPTNETITCREVRALSQLEGAIERAELWECAASSAELELRLCCADELKASGTRSPPAAVSSQTSRWLIAAATHEFGLVADDHEVATALGLKNSPRRALDHACEREDINLLRDYREALASECPKLADGARTMNYADWRGFCDHRVYESICESLEVSLVAAASNRAAVVVRASFGSFERGSKAQGIHEGFASELARERDPERRFDRAARRLEQEDDEGLRRKSMRSLERIRGDLEKHERSDALMRRLGNMSGVR